MKQNKIRFKGFTENLKEVKLWDIFKHSSERSTINNQYGFLSVWKAWVSLQSDNFDRQIAMKNNIWVPILKRNQFVMNPYFLYLGLFKLNEDFDQGIVSQAYKVFDFENKKWNIDYFNQIIKTNYLLKKFENISDKGNAKLRRSVKIENFKNIKIDLPSLEEQERIAFFLWNIDRKIELEEKKLNRLEEYKEWMLQKVFSQEVRFKDENYNTFSNDWKEVKLWDISNIYFWKLDANEMKEDWIYPFFTCAEKVYKIDKFEYEQESILIAWNWASLWHIHYYNWKFNAYQKTFILDKFKSNVKYLKYFLNKYLPKLIFQEKLWGGLPYITKSSLNSMKIFLPNKILEQEKIWNFFENINKLIEQQKKIIDNNKKYKSWLLQKMF